jgi:hypothetical protein
VETFLADTARRAEATAIRVQLETWRDNHARLAPMLGSAKQAQDIRTLSERLATAATIGLVALDAIERKQPLPAADVARYTRDLTAAAAPRAAVINPAIPAIWKLLDRAGDVRGCGVRVRAIHGRRGLATTSVHRGGAESSADDPSANERRRMRGSAVPRPPDPSGLRVESAASDCRPGSLRRELPPRAPGRSRSRDSLRRG